VKSMLQPEVREEVRRRLASVAADGRARWGRMDAPHMVAHLADSMRMSLGDLAVTPKRLPVRYPPLKQLLLYVLPIPKGVPTATELVSREPASLDDERRAIDDLLDRMGRRDPEAPAPAHPAFGPLTVREWGVLGWKHCDHHLRQFGV